MEPKQLVHLLHHYSGSSIKEAEEGIMLRDKYPYSQVLQVLAARVSKDHGFSNHHHFLQSAAVYCTDRSILKEIMLEPYIAVEAIPKGNSEVALPVTAASIDTTDYAKEVIIDLKRLHKLKHNFEALADKLKSDSSVLKVKPKKKAPGRPKKIKIDPLIESIKTTKQKIDPERQKTKEQIEIIDQFIKAQPSIKPKVEQVPQNDLTDSGEFSDNIISETLAGILIRQGKKEKAIEVYRKLIWKFPQKKAYFAAKIEELKK